MEAVEKIDIRLKDNPVFNKSIDNKRWIYILVGEIATYAILLAATKYSYQENPSIEIKKAISWTKLQFERKINDALNVTPNELVTETADKTSELIDFYVNSIGDIQQNLVGEDREIDEFCRGECHSPIPESPQKSPKSIQQQNILPKKNDRSIQDWLSQWLSNKLQIPLKKIDRAKAFADYGIDSVMAVELAQDLGEWLPDNLEIEPTLAWNFPSIEALAGYLGSRRGRGAEVQREQEEIDVEGLSEDELAKSLMKEIALAKGRDN